MSGGDAEAGGEPLERTVRLPLGAVRVRLDRRGLGTGERGGFEARWAEPGEAGGALDRDAFHALVKTHLRAVAQAETGREPTGPTLNLAAHQLVDDVEGWTHLNAPRT